jgi:hypothetical protein
MRPAWPHHRTYTNVQIARIRSMACAMSRVRPPSEFLPQVLAPADRLGRRHGKLGVQQRRPGRVQPEQLQLGVALGARTDACNAAISPSEARAIRIRRSGSRTAIDMASQRSTRQSSCRICLPRSASVTGSSAMPAILAAVSPRRCPRTRFRLPTLGPRPAAPPPRATAQHGAAERAVGPRLRVQVSQLLGPLRHEPLSPMKERRSGRVYAGSAEFGALRAPHRTAAPAA